jgi:hypothetical protein
VKISIVGAVDTGGINMTHLTAIWSHVLSSIKIISGIVCVKNIMKHDMIAEYLTTSNMRWHTDLCGPSFLRFDALLPAPLVVDDESWSFFFFFRILPEVLDCDTLSSTLDEGKEETILILFWLGWLLVVELPLDVFASDVSMSAGGGGGADTGGGATAPRKPGIDNCSLVPRSSPIDASARSGVDSTDVLRLWGCNVCMVGVFILEIPLT